MSPPLCPKCRQSVAPDDVRCPACEADLLEGDTVPGSLRGGALWIDIPPGPAAATPMPAPGQRHGRITLRPIEAPARQPPSDDIAWRRDMVVTDPPLHVERTKDDDSFLHNLILRDSSARKLTKAAMRAAVRRARLGRASTPADAPAEGNDVLVLDPSEASRKALCTLLLGFGFRIVLASGAAHARTLVERQGFSAAFLDVPLDETDGGAGVEVCRQLKASAMQPEGRGTAVVLVASEVRPVDKIRARLAGCDAVIAKPPKRGDVARALETCGVPLPSDARRRT